MRLLAGMGMMTEVGPLKFKPTSLAGVHVTGSPLADAVVHVLVKFTTTFRQPDVLRLSVFI